MWIFLSGTLSTVPSLGQMGFGVLVILYTVLLE